MSWKKMHSFFLLHVTPWLYCSSKKKGGEWNTLYLYTSKKGWKSRWNTLQRINSYIHTCDYDGEGDDGDNSDNDDDEENNGYLFWFMAERILLHLINLLVSKDGFSVSKSPEQSCCQEKMTWYYLDISVGTEK